MKLKLQSAVFIARATLTLLVFSLSVSSTAAKEQLRLYTELFTPYQFIKEGKLVGINTQLVEKACDVAGIDCIIEPQSWNRAYNNALKQPNSGVFSTFRASEREDQFVWVGPLVHSEEALVFALASRTDINATDITNLSQLTVGVIDNDILSKELERNGFERGRNLYLLKSRADGLHLFFNGRLDLLVGSPITMPYLLAERCLHIDSLKTVATLPLLGSGNYLALNKNVGTDLASRLQHAVETLHENGFVTQLLEQYSAPVVADGCQR